MNKRILVLGATGLVGHTIFRYLNTLYPHDTFGTSRDKLNIKKNIFYLSAENFEYGFKLLKNKVSKIDYVINCIGITREVESRKNLVYVNSYFPHLLEEYAEKYNFKLIHISTDAVFPTKSGRVFEYSKVCPETFYGSSKWLGETSSKKAISIRTSIVGLDPIYHRGILEISQGDEFTKASISQMWSGCTSLQFAKFCNFITNKERFDKIREATPVMHFSPIKKISKYSLILNYLKAVNNKKVINKAKLNKTTRILDTAFSSHSKIEKFIQPISAAMRELIDFEYKNIDM